VRSVWDISHTKLLETMEMYVFIVITTYLKETEVYLWGGNEIF